jgi:methenyltetrahydromethanopterin cyclohydrolase
MAQESKVLLQLNDTLDIPLDTDWNGAAGIEYGLGADGSAGSGTVVIEATVSGLAWFPLTLKKSDGTTAANLSAAGIAYIETTGYTKCRARMSVVGGAQGVRVWVNQKRT